MKMKKAVVFRHVYIEDLGRLADQLSQNNYEVGYIEIVSSSSLDDFDALEPDLLVVLGGYMSVNDIVNYPFLSDEIRILKQRLSYDLPTFGICLGSQLMAKALGANVYEGSVTEIGWLPINLSDAGNHSALGNLATVSSGRSSNCMVMQWHRDTFDLPAGAVHLASSAEYHNQAFSWGKNGLALQFHPEVTSSGLESWFVHYDEEILNTPGISIKQFRRDTADYVEELEIKVNKFWQKWLEGLEN